MRSRTALLPGLAAALIATSLVSSALAQQPAPAQPPPQQPAVPFQLPGLPPIQIPGMTPVQPDPNQQQPQQAPPAAQPQPGVIPGFTLPPNYNQPAPAQPAPYGQPNGQYGQPNGQYGQPNYGQPNGQYGQPYAPMTGPKKKRNRSTPLEIGYLYTVATAYGVGMGIWIDAEAQISDPGLRFVPPILTGAAAPVGVFFLDTPPLPKGLPSAIATGMLIGGAEGLGVTTYQSVSSLPGQEWGFRGFARAEMIGATLGGGAGFGYWMLTRAKPQHSMFYASASAWGALIGSQMGLGGSSNSWSYGPQEYTNDAGQTIKPGPNATCPQATKDHPVMMETIGCENGANAATARGGLIGMNVFLAGALAVGHAWNPSWNQIGWMWGGLAIGEAATLPVYLFYAGSKDHDPRHGLIVQGIGGTIGIVGGALIGRPDHRGRVAELDEDEMQKKYWETDKHRFKLTGGGLMPVENGMGLSMSGQIW